jgi:predicted amidohydrolase YtcJ
MPLSHQLEAYRSVGLVGPFGDGELSIGHLKVYADGSLTGGTAAFSEELHVRGQDASFFHEPGDLVELIERAWSSGWRVAVHAQGDLAISSVLDGFEKGHGPHDDPRPRIEHCGYPGQIGIQRMRAVGAIAVNQPSYLHDYGDAYAESMGDAVHDLQPWRDELDAGVRVVISSDSDVSSYRPLTTIANAMLRRTRDGTSIGPRQRLTLEEALFAHTIDAAYAIGADHRIGSLEPTKDADLTILGRRHPLDGHCVCGGAPDPVNPRARGDPVRGRVGRAPVCRTACRGRRCGPGPGRPQSAHNRLRASCRTEPRHPSLVHREGNRLQLGSHTEFGEDVLQMGADRVGTDVQLGRD